MAKNNVTQYDTTAANNTDVGGISIAEGMSPSNVNNAMRELMKHTADWVSGSQAITKLTTTGDIELGHASDTTISRSSAGTVTIEGAEIRTGTVAVANGGTGSTSAGAARTALGVDAAGTDNSTPVTLAGTPDYITISGQEITRNAIDLTADVSGALPIANGGTGGTTAAAAASAIGVGTEDSPTFSGLTTTGSAALDGAVTINDSGADADFRVESSGNANMFFVDGGNNRVGIGTSGPGAELEIAGDYQPLIVNSTNGSGAKIILEDNGVTRGYLGGASSMPITLYNSSATLIGGFDTSGTLRPGADNSQSLGNASYRWSEVFAGTGTINTSDQREKTDIADLDEAERRVAVALKGLVKKYKYKDAVAAKGSDAARIHVGVIAQEVVAAFAAEGLDATRYALLCHDEWETVEEVLNDDGEVVTPGLEAGDRYGVRYDEMLAFIISAL